MTPEAILARQLLAELAGLLPNAIDREYPGYQGCILATRMAIEVLNHFGIPARPLPVQVIVYNAPYREHIKRGDELDIARWLREDGAYSVGIGFGEKQPTTWNGHLIVVAHDTFADYTIQQAHRPEHGIEIAMPIVGPYGGNPAWTAENDLVTVEYKTTTRNDFRNAPDWRDQGRRRRICGPLIREMDRRFS